MNMRATGAYPAGLPSPTDRRIGDAFPIVEEVHKYLKQLVYLAENSEKFVAKQIEFQANPELEVIEWRYKGDPEWTVLVSYTELVGVDLSSMEETLNQIIDNGVETLTQKFVEQMTDFEGEIEATPEWTPVPAHAVSGLDPQAQALVNRTEFIVEELTEPSGSSPIGGVDAYSKVREYAGNATRMRIIGKGIKGWFVRDGSSHADDGGKYLVDALGRTWVREGAEEEVFNVAHYGALLGENASDAFLAASAAIRAAGGGEFVIPAGEYIIGKQVPKSPGSLLMTWSGGIIDIYGCTKPVTINAKGVKLKWQAGLMYGTFDPNTGERFDPVMPYLDGSTRCNIGYAIRLYNNDAVTVHGSLEIDGNASQMKIGGKWGDAGWQIPHSGIWAVGNKSFSAFDIKTHHHCLDGILTGMGYDNPVFRNETYETAPITLHNVKATHNGRLGWALVGGKNTTAIGCKFNFNGRSIENPVVSSPASGVDVEAEAGWIRDVLFINCEFVENLGNGLVAYSGNTSGIKALGCKFIASPVNTASYALWIEKPRATFEDCLVVGPFFTYNAQENEGVDNTRLLRCTITDDPKYLSSGKISTPALMDTSYRKYPIIDSCKIELFDNRFSGNYNGIIRNTTMDVYSNPTATRYLGIFNPGALLEEFTVVDKRESPLSNLYFEFHSYPKTKGNVEIVSPTNKIGWRYAGGPSGKLINESQALSYVELVRNGRSSMSMENPQKRRVFSHPEIPTTGDWLFGDVLINSNPTNTSWKFAHCVTPSVDGSGAVFVEYGAKATGLTSASSAADIVAALKAAGLAS